MRIVMSSSDVAALPFIKWAGGKRQLLAQIKARIPCSYNQYYEPFVGGGAVLFGLLPATAVINDVNKALINAYRKIAEVPIEFLEQISQLILRCGKTEKPITILCGSAIMKSWKKESMM